MFLKFRTNRSGQTVQTQRGAIWSGSTLFAIPSASFGRVTLWKIHISHFRIITVRYISSGWCPTATLHAIPLSWLTFPDNWFLSLFRWFLLKQTENICHYSPFKQPHDKTNKMTMCPANTQISLGIRPVWSKSLLCTQWVAKDPSFLHADSEDSDQLGLILNIWTERPGHTV